jgi:uncharacterized membrane protein
MVKEGTKMNLWELLSKNPIVTIVISVLLAIMLLELWLSRKINLNASKFIYKYPQEQIMALLIEKGGKMSRAEISNYLDWPMDFLILVLLEMEKEELIGREGETEDFIVLKKGIKEP